MKVPEKKSKKEEEDQLDIDDGEEKKV